MALPKHPQARTHWFAISTSWPEASVIIFVPNGSQFAVYQVSHVKKPIITAVNAEVNFG